MASTRGSSNANTRMQTASAMGVRNNFSVGDVSIGNNSGNIKSTNKNKSTGGNSNSSSASASGMSKAMSTVKTMKKVVNMNIKTGKGDDKVVIKKKNKKKVVPKSKQKVTPKGKVMGGKDTVVSIPKGERMGTPLKRNPQPANKMMMRKATTTLKPTVQPSPNRKPGGRKGTQRMRFKMRVRVALMMKAKKKSVKMVNRRIRMIAMRGMRRNRRRRMR